MAELTDLMPWVAAYARLHSGKTFRPEYEDHVAAFKRQPELLELARTERERLDELNAQLHGNLEQRDHIQHTRRVALIGMLSNYDRAIQNERDRANRKRTANLSDWRDSTDKADPADS